MKNLSLFAILSLSSLVFGIFIGVSVMEYPSSRKELLQTIYFNIDPPPAEVTLEEVETINTIIYSKIQGVNSYLVFSGGVKIFIIGKSGSTINPIEVDKTVMVVSNLLTKYSE